MRRDNDDMDVITRTEFDEAMKHFITKEDLQAALGDTKAEIVDVIKSQLTSSRFRNLEDFRGELANAKLEILSVNKKNIADSIAPLVEGQKTLVEGQKTLVEGQKALVEGQKALNTRLDAVGIDMKKLLENMEGLNESVSERLNQQDRRLDRAGL